MQSCFMQTQADACQGYRLGLRKSFSGYHSKQDSIVQRTSAGDQPKPQVTCARTRLLWRQGCASWPAQSSSQAGCRSALQRGLNASMPGIQGW